MIRYFPPHKSTVTGYALAILLIPVYVNMFPIWKYLNSTMPEGTMVVLPVSAVLLAVAASVTVFIRKRRQTLRVGQFTLLTGLFLCLAALAIPDPSYPIKRIHVAEYMLVALVCRYAMSRNLNGAALLVFSAFFAALLGVHDEFLQGLHPARTYGLRDMSVNILASCGGALVWHGLRLFVTCDRPDKRVLQNNLPVSLLFLTTLALSVLAMTVPMMAYKGYTAPAWPGLILSGAFCFWTLYRDHVQQTWRHGITAVSVAAFSLLAYPLIPMFSDVTFY